GGHDLAEALGVELVGQHLGERADRADQDEVEGAEPDRVGERLDAAGDDVGQGEGHPGGAVEVHRLRQGEPAEDLDLRVEHQDGDQVEGGGEQLPYPGQQQ